MTSRDDAQPRSRDRTAYLLLTATAMLWAGNVVASKWAPGVVSPQALTCLRWALACAVLAPVAGRAVASEWGVLAPSWRRVLTMGAFGYTAYASLFYAAGARTSAVNLALFQGAIPVLVLLLNYAVRGAPVSRGQVFGVAVTLAGVGVAASRGEWAVIAGLAFNAGDLLMLGSCLLYAGYTVALPGRPTVSGLVFFTAMAAAALLTSLPPMALEWAAGGLVWPDARGWALVGFVALGPSLAAQLAFMKGVALIGPNRAGLFLNLVPIFGATLAILVVGERFHLYDALALALVVGGIVIAERFGSRQVTPRSPGPLG